MKQITFKQKVVQGIYDLFYVWKQELRNLFRDQGVLIFFVLVPLTYPLIYSFIYTNETVREVPAVVVDNSRSSLSREYLRKVDASPETSIVAHCADMEEARLMLKERKAYGIIYIPSGFSDDIVRGKQTQVSIFCDMSGLLYYKALLTANTNVSLAMNADIKMERAGNTTARQDEITAYPIEYEDIAIFNPTNGFAAFLIPAVLILIIQQTLLLGIGLAAGTAREQNRFKELIPDDPHYNGTLRIVMGKGLSYFMVYSLVAVYILCVVPRLFSLNQIAIPSVLALFALPYLTACIFFAMTASICHTQPGNLYVIVCVHFRTAVVPLRHLLAGRRNARILEVFFLYLPFHFRNQRLCTYQQHGSHPQRSSLRVSGPMDTNRNLLPHHLPRLPEKEKLAISVITNP